MDPYAKKPRGRPPGSRNKTSSTSHLTPKPDDTSMKVFTLNVPPNRDIMEFIFDVAHRDNVNVTVLSASGTVNNVTLHNFTHGAHETMMDGPFTLLSFSGTYLYTDHDTLLSGATPPFPLSFGINISSSHGQILGGVIGGSVISGDNVSLTISTFKNPGVLNYTFEGEDKYANNNNNDNINSSDFGGDDNLLGLNTGVRGW